MLYSVSHFSIFVHFHCLKLAPRYGAKELQAQEFMKCGAEKKIQAMSYIILVQLWVMVHGIQCQQIKNIFIQLALYKQGYILTGW